MNKQETMQKPESKEATRMAVAVLSVMDSLARVMDQEVALLEKQDVTGIEVLRRDKARYSYDYHTSIKTLSKNPELLKAASEEERAQLKSAGEKLALSVRRNADQLKSAILATSALVQTVMDAARKEVMTNECYTNPNNNHFMMGNYSPTTAPVAVDRSA